MSGERGNPVGRCRKKQNTDGERAYPGVEALGLLPGAREQASRRGQ